MKNIDTINALNNPLSYGDKIQIKKDVFIVGQTIAGGWYVSTDDKMSPPVFGMVGFVRHLVNINEGLPVQWM